MGVVLGQDERGDGESRGVVRLVILTLVVIGYLFLGMILFYKIEQPNEEAEHRKRIPLRRIVESYKDDNPSVNETALQQLLTEVLEMSQDGRIEWKGADPRKWTYPRSIYFAVSVITTIGFGNVILKTSFGRLFSVLYAIIGIPLSVLLYLEIGKLLNENLFSLLLKLHKHFQANNTPLSTKTVAKVNALFVFIFGTVCFILLPSVAIHILEDEWSYAEACYFSFTTIATIGYGDYVAGADEVMPSQQMHWYRAALTIWIFVGLGWLSTLLNAIGDVVQDMMDKGEEMISHEYDQILDEDHNNHCPKCRRKRNKSKVSAVTSRKREPSTPELEEDRGYHNE